LTESFTSSSLFKRLPQKIPSMLRTSENHLGASLDSVLDAQKLPSQILEALLALWQQHAGTQTVFTFWTTLVQRNDR
jgi:hypothetical protein